MKRLCAIILW